jgi:hypothetical protein
VAGDGARPDGRQIDLDSLRAAVVGLAATWRKSRRWREDWSTTAPTQAR